MTSRFPKTVSRSSALCAGIAAALVCTLDVPEAGAKVAVFDGLRHRLDHVMEPITKPRMPAKMTLAQYADDCGCDDVEAFDEDFDDEYADEFDEDFAEDVEDDFDDDYAEDVDDGDGYAGDVGAQTSHSQSVTADQQERLDNLNRNMGKLIEQQILWRNPMGPGVY